MKITYRIESANRYDEHSITLGTNLEQMLRIVQHIGHSIVQAFRIEGNLEELINTEKIVFNVHTQTFRTAISNYWVASLKDNVVVFDSWDGIGKVIGVERKKEVLKCNKNRLANV